MRIEYCSMRKLYIALLVCLFLLILPEWVNFSRPFPIEYNFILDYTRNAIISILEILITLVFVEKILQEQHKDDEKDIERKKILRLIKILTPAIVNMQIEAWFMIHSDSQNEEDFIPKKWFDFNRLKSFFIPSLRIDSGSERAYKIFLYKLWEVRSLIRDFLINVDMKYYPELETLFLKYIEFTGNRDLKDAFNYYEFNPELVKSSKIMLEKIPSWTIPKREDYPSNSMTSFITLYELIDYNITFLEEYWKIIQPIIDNK